MSAFATDRPAAFVYAGQGAQYVGMGAVGDPALASLMTRTIDSAGAALGDAGLATLISSGPEEQLTLTENAQPAILAVGHGHYTIARARGLRPLVCLGHSLGEYGAWVAAGSLSFAEAIGLVRLRGQFMQSAVPVGSGAMRAVVGPDAGTVEILCAEVSKKLDAYVGVAVYNCPGNTVVSGETEAVVAVEQRIDDERLGIVVELSVSAPFHTPLLASAADQLNEALDAVTIESNSVPVAANVSGEIVQPGASPRTIRELLVEQVVAPVRWESCLRAAIELGAEQALLLGPGTMVRGHIKRIRRRFVTLAMDEDADLAHLEA